MKSIKDIQPGKGIEVELPTLTSTVDDFISLSNEISNSYKEEAKKRGPMAHWDITLYVDCPNCNEYVDLTRADDFWSDRNESFGPFSGMTDLEAICPECGHEFLCDVYW